MHTNALIQGIGDDFMRVHLLLKNRILNSRFV